MTRHRPTVLALLVLAAAWIAPWGRATDLAASGDTDTCCLAQSLGAARCACGQELVARVDAPPAADLAAASQAPGLGLAICGDAIRAQVVGGRPDPMGGPGQRAPPSSSI